MIRSRSMPWFAFLCEIARFIKFGNMFRAIASVNWKNVSKSGSSKPKVVKLFRGFIHKSCNDLLGCKIELTDKNKA